MNESWWAKWFVKYRFYTPQGMSWTFQQWHRASGIPYCDPLCQWGLRLLPLPVSLVLPLLPLSSSFLLLASLAAAATHFCPQLVVSGASYAGCACALSGDCATLQILVVVVAILRDPSLDDKRPSNSVNLSLLSRSTCFYSSSLPSSSLSCSCLLYSATPSSLVRFCTTRILASSKPLPHLLVAVMQCFGTKCPQLPLLPQLLLQWFGTMHH